MSSRNLTPDPLHGIGAWRAEDFVRAPKEGIAPDGTHYYPAFPYRSFTLMSRDDLLALRAYLATMEPVARPERPHDLAWYAGQRWSLRLWIWLNFDPAPGADTATSGGLRTDGIYQDLVPGTRFDDAAPPLSAPTADAPDPNRSDQAP